ncbi:uncharacterized protein LOC119719467 [Patiria miniata]|uniref:Death domain-containing protein n=1 Tax=Patiria miniata TaxID=46514 RepID=A0A913YYR3_PATMI|nr:uncharacterized protein LOC119719467 [Patiria miniata]XP_038044869.1 uncharacterized protein LOC119719467 [Patiria miniata]
MASTNPAKDPNESSEMATPTSESIVQAFTVYASSKDAEIKELKAQLAAAESENLDLKSQKATWFLEKKSLSDRVERLERELKMLQDLQRRQAAGVSSMGVSTDGRGDAAPGPLLSRVESLEKGMASVRIGGEHPESCPSPVCSEHLVETDGQITDLPNTHLKSALLAGSDVPQTETTAAGEGKVPAGRAAVPAETKAAAMASQQGAFDKLESRSYSFVQVSSKEKVTECPVSTEMMEWLSENLTLADWKPLMRKLGLTDVEIGNASFGHPHVVEQRYQCLLHWRKTHSRSATVPTLLTAIRAKSLHQLARDFCKEFPAESSPVETKRESTPELTRNFLSNLERFLDPFVADFDALKQDLHNGPRISQGQCLKIGYRSQEGNGRLDTVMEDWSSTYYKKNNSDSELDKRWALRKFLQNCGKEVRAIFKKHVNQGGVIGPAAGDDAKIGNLPYSTIQDIEEMLSYTDGVRNWKDLADWLRKQHPSVFQPVTKNKIRLWENDPDPRKGAKSVLQVWETTTQAKVGALYSWLVENGRLDIAKVLE